MWTAGHTGHGAGGWQVDGMSRRLVFPIVDQAGQLVGYSGPLRRLVDTLGVQNLSLLVALAVVIALIASQNSRFSLPQNLLNIGQNVSVVGLVAAVETVIIVAGALDISVGAVAGIASVVAGLAVVGTGSPAFAVVMGMAAGLMAGVVNGLIITIGRVNPVIATLATLSAFRGVAFLIAPEGKPVGVINPAFNAIGAGRLDLGFQAGVPISLVILLGVALTITIFCAIQISAGPSMPWEAIPPQRAWLGSTCDA